jgi:murein DD-endopeptidase MepM/ murein hydrolase activator NlpD
MLRGVLAALLLAGAARAEPPKLVLPVDCAYGKDCFVQSYVDVDPGPGRVDFTCGPLTYDGHRGTDFRPADPRRKISVRAAAPGTVSAVRDGVADGIDTGDMDCGNGARIDHGAGWQTLYCHLARGSLRVKSGDVVGAGQPLGVIGRSGRAAYRHLHFEVLQDGKSIDPFLRSKGGTTMWRGAGPALGTSAGLSRHGAAWSRLQRYRAGSRPA